MLGHFAADIDPVKAKVMYTVQQPLTMSAFDDAMGTLAWRSLPSWYLVAEHDEVIPPDAERQFAQRMGAAVPRRASIWPRVGPLWNSPRWHWEGRRSARSQARRRSPPADGPLRAMIAEPELRRSGRLWGFSLSHVEAKVRSER